MLVASDGIAALTALRENRHVGVIVADVELGGLTLAREARTIRPNMGVVYASVAPHRVPESAKESGTSIFADTFWSASARWGRPGSRQACAR